MQTENTSQPMQETGTSNGAQAGTQRELTYGEKAVRLTFDPSDSSEINAIKKVCAAAIDMLHGFRILATEEGNGEKIAQYTLAIRKITEGKFWAVNAFTWPH